MLAPIFGQTDPEPLPLTQNLNDTEIDIPDPYAIHTPKGKILEQPVLSGEDISIMYYQLTGKRVLLSSAFKGIEVSIIQPGPITNKEVTELMSLMLRL